MRETPLPAQLAETHSGVLVAIGDLVYKAKKPVDLGFLDFSTVERRRAVCHREVELNRRLAPDVYHGVADVHGPDGTVCEHLVVMRRMPPERALDAVADAEDRSEDRVRDRVQEVAATLADFHRGADRSPEIDDEGRAPALHRRWRANVDDLRRFTADRSRDAPLDPRLVDELEHLASRFVEGRHALFEQRVAQRRVLDGHGDLLCSDIFCLDDGPRLLDCLEFDDRLRWADGIDDAAGLVMDLHHRGHPGTAEEFLRRYRELAGDAAPQALVDFYVASRAVIRAKAACLRGEQAEGDERSAAAEQARGLAEMARTRLRRAGPELVLVGGPPASGTSTLAGALGERIGAPVISSDQVRKELAGLDPDARAPEAATDLYSAEQTARTYAEMLRRAASELAGARTVLLDASWGDDGRREDAARVADRTHSTLRAIRCTVDRATAVARARDRAPGASDAGPELAERLAAVADDWPGAEPVDTSGDVADAVAESMAVLGWR